MDTGRRADAWDPARGPQRARPPLALCPKHHANRVTQDSRRRRPCDLALEHARAHVRWRIPVLAHSPAMRHISFCIDHCSVHVLKEDLPAPATPRPELARHGWYAPAR